MSASTAEHKTMSASDFEEQYHAACESFRVVSGHPVSSCELLKDFIKGFHRSIDEHSFLKSLFSNRANRLRNECNCFHRDYKKYRELKGGLDRHLDYYSDRDRWIAEQGSLNGWTEYMDYLLDGEVTERLGILVWRSGLRAVEALGELWKEVKQKEKEELRRQRLQRVCPNLSL